MLWVARFLAAGSAVTIASMLSRRFGGSVGGMVLAFPFVIGTGLLFALLEGGEVFRETASGALRGLLPLCCFTLVVVVLSRSHPVTALVAGFLSWLVVAAVLQWLS
jgi:hypothetical protein